MPSSTFRCVCKTFAKLASPIQGMLKDVLILFLVEFLKFCIYLLLVFGVGYSIFYLWNASVEDRKPLVNDLNAERLSAGLLEDGSFSKYPYVVELPTKNSAES